LKKKRRFINGFLSTLLKEIKHGVSASQFEDYKIGDKLDKKKGDIWPTKIE